MIVNFSNQLVSIIYRLLQPFGISYFISYIFKYPSKHAASNFCGNLLHINDEYMHAGSTRKAELTEQFVSIIDALVLSNGVSKTTYSGRHNTALSSICDKNQHYIDNRPIHVLDIPSSVGLSSIDNYNTLKKHYTINSYMMADQYFEVLYDIERKCIFDESGELLQVLFRNQFFSIYRPHTSGNAFGIIAKLLLSPLELISRSLRKKYKFEHCPSITKLLLLHPEARVMVNQGAMNYQKADIFETINGQYDLILSFNLLQKNYFSAEQIETGTGNLFDALNDGGLMITGSTESYIIAQKEGDKLVKLESVGDF